MAKILLFNKPFRVLSQFTDEGSGKATLAQYINTPNVYAAGRLDYDSEGLLLLTDNGHLQHRIADPKHKLEKTYWVQVEGEPSQESLDSLRAGITLKDGPTKPAIIEIIDEPKIWPRTPPIRERASIPTTWLAITISEGRNRQVRRMTAAIKHPTLRLIRAKIGDWEVTGLQPGEIKELDIPIPKPKARKKTSYSSKRKFAKIRPNQPDTP